jgi:hypothetical protein
VSEEPAGDPADDDHRPRLLEQPGAAARGVHPLPLARQRRRHVRKGMWVPIRDVQVEACVDRLDWRVTEVSSKADGCDILADQQVSLLGLSYGDPFDYVLCLRWYRPDRT